MPKREVGEIITPRRGRPFYAIRYYDARGRRHQESAGSAVRADAERLLRKRLKAKDDGRPIDPRVDRLKFDDAAHDLITDYTIHGRKSLDEAQRRIDKHLTPFFGGLRLAGITAADVRTFIAKRQAETYIVRKARGDEPAVRRSFSNAEINRELTTLKRMFSLAIQAEKLFHKPYIPLLREDNTRTGFFEVEAFRAVCHALPADLRSVVTFAYITGWRIASEVFPLEWRHVDFRAGEVRLDAGTTKNGEGRVFPLTDELRALLDAQHAAHVTRTKAGTIAPWVFVRMIAKGRGGDKKPRPLRAFTKAWNAACLTAGCPGRIPHDLRRTAVRNMVRRGVPERVAMQLTGHKTRSVFERYNIVSDGDLTAAATKLAGLLTTTARATATTG